MCTSERTRMAEAAAAHVHTYTHTQRARESCPRVQAEPAALRDRERKSESYRERERAVLACRAPVCVCVRASRRRRRRRWQWRRLRDCGSPLPVSAAASSLLLLALSSARAAYLDAAKNSPCHGQQRYFKKLKPHWYRGARRSNEFPPLYERELGARPYDNYTTAPTPQQRTPGHFVRRSPSRINIYTPRFSAFLPFSLFRPVFPSLLLSARGAIFSSRTLAPPRWAGHLPDNVAI